MSDEDILKTVADELRRYGDFDNIDYLIPKLGQAIENILEENKELEYKYVRALNDLVKAEKKKNELKEEIEKFNKQLDLDYVDKNFIPVSLVRKTIEENKGYLEYANTAYEYTQREVIEENIKILQKLIGDD